MIALRLIGEVPKTVEIQGHLSAIDLPGVYLAIVVLLLVYLKPYPLKRTKFKKSSVFSQSDFEYAEYDILAQPKKIKHQRAPFTNYALPFITLKEFLLIVILTIFYYWLILSEVY